jgi:mono/diheme cytochrome c family protein
MIYCVVCHDPLGTGHGTIVQRGYTPPPSYHIERLRTAPVGHLFAVISEGYGSMPSYADQIPTRDRWAIVAYLRALQASQHYPEAAARKIGAIPAGTGAPALAGMPAGLPAKAGTPAGGTTNPAPQQTAEPGENSP